MGNRRAKSKQLKDMERKRQYTQRSFKTFEEFHSEQDTAHSIVRSLSVHNVESGDVIFTEKLKGTIQDELLSSKYCIEIERGVGFAPKREWYDIAVDVADKSLDGLEEGQVLNCPLNPCWWR